MSWYDAERFDNADATRFFRAAAALHRLAPWRVLPDEGVLAVSIAPLSLVEAAVAVSIPSPQSFGFSVFDDVDSLTRYRTAGRVGNRSASPGFVSFEFIRGSEVDPQTRAAVVKNAWEIAAPTAYPSIVAVAGDLSARPITSDDLAVVEAVAEALTILLEAGVDLRGALAGGDPVREALLVETCHGALQATLSAPLVC